MNTVFLIAVLVVQPADSQAIAQLFDALDTDANGKITSSEISATQQPYFARALRVSDRNEDGALTREELNLAVADQPRVEIPNASRAASRMSASFDPASLDRNKDGYISKAEIPQPVQARFQRLFDQAGSDRISVDAVKKFVSYAESMNGTANRDASNRKTDDPQAAKSQSSKGPNSRRSATRSPDTFFDRLDANKDGQLTGDEIPNRMRQTMKRIDRNNDRSISKAEFAAMANSMQKQDGDSK